MEMSDIYRYIVSMVSISIILIGDLKAGGKWGARILKIVGFSIFILLYYFTNYSLFQITLLLTTIIVSLIISLYTVNYSELKYGTSSLQLLVDGLAISIIMTLASRYLLEFIMFWLSSEIIGFLAIAYDTLVGVDMLAMNASIKYLVFSMIPTDITLFMLLALTNFENMLTMPITGLSFDLSPSILTVIAFLGFMAKAAIVPLHFWLPDAHSMAPSPISAFLSGIMVKMGIYGFTILTYSKLNIDSAFSMLLIFGFFTAIYGALQAIYQRDVKRLLAYSTISHTGTIAIFIAFYIKLLDPIFIYAVIVYSLAHALYKAALFSDSGFIEVLAHDRNIDNLGYIYRIAPIESLSAMISILSIFGMPPAIGFLAKILAFSSLLHYIAKDWIYLFTLTIISIEISLSIIYSTKYLSAHIKLGKEIDNVSNINLKALNLVPYVLLLSIASIALTPIAFTIYGGDVLSAIKIDALLIYIATIPLLIFILIALYTSFKQSISMRKQ